MTFISPSLYDDDQQAATKTACCSHAPGHWHNYNVYQSCTRTWMTLVLSDLIDESAIINKQGLTLTV